MWGALQNAAKAAQAVTQDTLMNAQQLLERLDGQEEDGNDVEEEEGEEGEGGDAAAAAAAAAMGADAPLGVVPAAKDGEVAKLKKQLAAVKRENKELASDLELARQQAAATKKLLQESSGADQTEVNLLKAELVRYKELEELSQERDLLIQTLGTENEGVSARVVALEAENAQLRSAAADAAAAKDAEVAALRAQVADLEKRATEALEVRACVRACSDQLVVLPCCSCDGLSLHAKQGSRASQEAEASDREQVALIQSLRDDVAAAAARDNEVQGRVQALEKERDEAVSALRASLEASKGGQAAVAELRDVVAARDAAQVPRPAPGAGTGSRALNTSLSAHHLITVVCAGRARCRAR
jgi:hypothetical protein